MVLLNFGFTNIQVSKNKGNSSKVNVKSNMNITDVRVSEAIKQKDQKAFNISFEYVVDYEPKAGSIKLQGDVLYLASEKLAEEIETAWKKNKQLPREIAVPVFNRILHNSTVEALLLSREVHLPAPLQLPKLEMKRVAKNRSTNATGAHKDTVSHQQEPSKETKTSSAQKNSSSETATKNSPKK